MGGNKKTLFEAIETIKDRDIKIKRLQTENSDLKLLIDNARIKISSLEDVVGKVTVERNNWKYKAENPPRLIKESEIPSGIVYPRFPDDKIEGQKQSVVYDMNYKKISFFILVIILIMNLIACIYLDFILEYQYLIYKK